MPGYGIAGPRSGRGLLPWAWARRKLQRSHNYWLATVKPNRAPHVMPVWGLWYEDVFYFSTGKTSRKARNLAANARCVVCSEEADKAVIVEGVAQELSGPALLKILGPLYFKKYGWELDPEMGPIFAVKPRAAFAFVEAEFQQAATRWLFPSA